MTWFPSQFSRWAAFARQAVVTVVVEFTSGTRGLILYRTSVPVTRSWGWSLASSIVHVTTPCAFLNSIHLGRSCMIVSTWGGMFPSLSQ